MMRSVIPLVVLCLALLPGSAQARTRRAEALAEIRRVETVLCRTLAQNSASLADMSRSRSLAEMRGLMDYALRGQQFAVVRTIYAELVPFIHARTWYTDAALSAAVEERCWHMLARQGGLTGQEGMASQGGVR